MKTPTRYEIRIAEHLDEPFIKWFGEIETISAEFGETILKGEMADQPALFGVLGKIRDLGLTLVSVQRVPDVTNPSAPGRALELEDASNEGR